MISNLVSFARSSLIALGVVACASTPLLAAPIGPTAPIQAAATGDQSLRPILVRDRDNYRLRRGGRHYRHEGRHYRHDNWRHQRRHYRRHRGPNIYFGLGLAYPAYRYYSEPRRSYRHRSGSSAHVQWCYARYRSYHAWDNTFQPHHRPRQQCWSPYR